MKANPIFIDSAQGFSEADKNKIIALTQRVFSDTAKILNITVSVNITFYRHGKKNSGFTQAKDWVAVTIPNGSIDYSDLEAMLYHEFHHTARGYAGYMEEGKKHYLLNSLFSEGLATVFELEKEPKGRKSTHGIYTMKLIREWLPKTKNELYNTRKYDYDGWFRGVGRPKKLGYKLGKYLVDQINKLHPELTHQDLVRKDARDLLKLSGVKI